VSARTLVLAALLALGGCAMGQKFGYSDAALTLRQVPRTSDLAVAVLDARSYVLQGRKRESFVGLSRGGYGNPFDVTTRSGAPLASEMADAIARSLGDEGRKIRVVKVEPSGGPDAARKALAATGAERLLLFTLSEWKTDTLARTGLDYDLKLEVLDRDGRPLAAQTLAGKEVSGSAILSAEKDARRWFAEKFASLLADPAVAAAL
jgi:hypothetical protein